MAERGYNDLEETIDRITKVCEDLFPKYMMPKHYMSINKIPYKGKIIDKKLITYYIKESLK